MRGRRGLQCVAVCCSVLQCVAVCCSDWFADVGVCTYVHPDRDVWTLTMPSLSSFSNLCCFPTLRKESFVTVYFPWPAEILQWPLVWKYPLHYTATHCNALQRTATHCNTLQHTATHCNTLQHTATHCSTLQHTATQCDTLQQTATQGSSIQHT